MTWLTEWVFKITFLPIARFQLLATPDPAPRLLPGLGLQGRSSRLANDLHVPAGHSISQEQGWGIIGP